MSNPGVSRDDLELLMLDWECQMLKDPNHDGWAHAGPTWRPVARDFYATLFLVNNHTDDPEADFKSFCRQVNQGGRLGGTRQIHLTIKPVEKREATSLHEKPVEMGLTDQTGGSFVVVLEGYMSVGREIQDLDPNIGNYIVLTAKTMEGLRTITLLHKLAAHGYAAIIPHNKVEVPLSDGLELVVTTGLGPEENSREASCSKDLSTLFLLQENKRDVARCHLKYRDGSSDPSIGPTIETLSIHRSARGKDLLPLLWHWVRSYVEENFTLETMSTDCAPGHCMIKASGLTNTVIEIRDKSSITDKEFFYQNAGFSVRQQESAMGNIMRSSGRPIDEEAVLYIPLLSREVIAKRATSPYIAFRAPWPEVTGARCCTTCKKVLPHSKLLRCARCKSAFYCHRTCQKRNWKRHKQWCGKTATEVHKILGDRGFVQ